MKLVIAQMKHETNTFSPVPTPLARFARGGGVPPQGQEALRAFKGTGAAIAAFFELAEAAGAEMVIPIAAMAWPSGPVEDQAFEAMAGPICAAVAQGCDGVLLDLHGAMVTRRFDDGEGELLRRIRAIAPEVPIGIALDMHTNLTAEMARHATVIAGYQTYPHVDTYETGLRAGRALLALLQGRSRPAMAWGRRPMLPHVMRQSSEDLPNRALQERCRRMEREGALAASVFVGFPHADIPELGLSAVVVTDGDEALARRWCDELLEMAWAARADFVYTPEPLEASMARAAALREGPVVLLDHCDNAASGGTMDSMHVLRAVLQAGLENVAAFAIYDPEAVREMVQAGVRSRVTVRLGGKLDMPAIGKRGEPLTVTGTVKLISDGRFRNRGPMGRGVLNDMGPTVVLDTGQVEIVVVSNQQEPNDFACFTSLGIDPLAKRFLLLKSRVHWRAGFRDVTRHVVECDGTGVCTSDYSALDFRRVPRPIYPLDAI
ncbi:MAG TPA: M81 family metallopeptidase [Ramlibacter sp.]|nr:M81 family metallopeptidase [Ramlibacter sp.]